MKLNNLVKKIKKENEAGYYYLASPYSKYPEGEEQAFIDISKIAANLIQSGIIVYCPIAHSHPLTIHGTAEKSYDIWLPLDQVFIAKSTGLIVAKMKTWKQSYGINFEIAECKALNKPIYYLDV